MPKLPDPPYFNIDELTERWQEKYGRCSQNYVLRCVETFRLAPAFLFKGTMVRFRYVDGEGAMRPYDLDLDAIPEDEIDGIKKLHEEDFPFSFCGIALLPVSQVKRYLFCSFPLSFEWKVNLESIPFLLPLQSEWHLGDKHCWIIPAYPFEITTADFVFLREEVARFEAENVLEKDEIAAPAKKNNFAAKNTSKRIDRLGGLLIDIVTELEAKNGKRPTCQEVFNRLKQAAKGGNHVFIQEVRSDTIFWTRGNGTEDETTKAALAKRLTRINSCKKPFPRTTTG